VVEGLGEIILSSPRVSEGLYKNFPTDFKIIMKYRLVQDSYTGEYRIEEEQITYNLYATPFEQRLWVKLDRWKHENFIQATYRSDQEEEAWKAFRHLVKKATSETIVLAQSDESGIILGTI
jgi:hypothetical protein